LRGLAAQRKVPVIGYVGGASSSYVEPTKAFLKGLAEAGYVDGRNAAIEYRWVETHNEGLPTLVSDLVSRCVTVMAVVDSTAAVLVAKAATQSIPIVFRIGGDPVAAGIVPNPNRPGGNITGITTLGIDLGAKRLQILRDILPTDANVALLSNPSNANGVARSGAEIQAAARQLGVRLLIFNITTRNDIDAAFTSFATQKIGGLMNTAEPLFFQNRDRLIALAVRYAVPAMYRDRLYTDAGGLMSYGTSLADVYRLVGVYTGRILKGEKPADFPVMQPTKFEFVINLKTAMALGLNLPRPYWRSPKR
jgi:putative tryptophan/tyrosine transport system substrate-binding protein